MIWFLSLNYFFHEIYTHLIINHRNLEDLCYQYYAERYVKYT